METLKIEQHNHVAILSFNRPKAMNSLNEAMSYELETATEQLRYDDNVHVVILKGEGERFMTGGDLKFFYDQLDVLPKGAPQIIQRLHASITEYYQHE